MSETKAQNMEASLADALRVTRDCLACWMGIQDVDEKDATSYDEQSIVAADKALAAYDAQQSAAAVSVDYAAETATLIQQLRDKGLVVAVWSTADVPEGTTDDPKAWLAEHADDITSASLLAGNKVIEARANQSSALRPR